MFRLHQLESGAEGNGPPWNAGNASRYASWHARHMLARLLVTPRQWLHSFAHVA